MMRKVYGEPTPDMARRDSSAGIQQVILNLERYLPEFGYELVNHPDGADLIAHHAGSGDGYTDVCINHGLYPDGMANVNTQSWHTEVNRRVIADLKAAYEITVPSEWVADIIRRDMHINPTVLHWGVDLELWANDKPHHNYVLWNKNRDEGVCTPKWMNLLADKHENIQFISTFGQASHNVQITGRVDHEVMQELVKGAAVYLATTKETGDIGSREALAAGIPVLGFAQGALLDIVEHGVNGYLARVDDIEDLSVGLAYVLEHRATLSANAVKLAQAYQWRDTAKALAEVFDRAYAAKYASHSISVIVPCFNYLLFVTGAIESVLAQQCSLPFELIIVNDGSTDNSLAVIEHYQGHPQVTVINQANQGVAHARNNGIRAASGDLIACLDADDEMATGFLEVCSQALLNNRAMGIAYTGIDVMDVGTSQWPEAFDYEQMTKRHNQVPSLCMFRKTAWERAGGFRQQMHPAEDADLWLRITSLGMEARKVTDAPLFRYRLHPNSASAPVRRRERDEPDWTGGKGWLTSGNLPFAAPHPKTAWPVRNYDQPLVSFIIPVGPNHVVYLQDALDSIESQTMPFWEAIVINDSGQSIATYPYAKIITTNGGKGAGYARNLGLRVARGQHIVFLDADDFILPTFLERCLRLYNQTGKYIYTDWIKDENGQQSTFQTIDYDPDDTFAQGSIHAVTALVPRRWAVSVGGFNEQLPAWEDVDFYIKLAIAGHCGKRLADALFVYRYHTGGRRETGASNALQLNQYFQQTYPEYVSGEAKIVCGCAQMKEPVFNPSMGDELLEVVYQGAKGNHAVVGYATKTNYGYRQGGEQFFVYSRDVQAQPERYQVITQIVEEYSENEPLGAPELV